MKTAKKKLKVYCETTFWSYLNGRQTSFAHIAVRQATTLQWWETFADKCEIFVSQYVTDEASEGDAARAELRRRSIAGFPYLDVSLPDIITPAEFLERKEDFGYE